MKSVRLDYPMGLLCRAFGVSRSGFYAWLNRAPSPRVQEDERLKVAIKAVHVQTRETYGPLRVQPELAAQGFEAGRDRIVRLRHELGLRCKQKRKFKATTNSRHNFPVAENLVNQTFTPTRPNEAWVTDITDISTGEGWLYLAGVKDVFTCELVGYAMGRAHDAGLDGARVVAGCTQQAASSRADSSLGPPNTAPMIIASWSSSSACWRQCRARETVMTTPLWKAFGEI